MRHLRQRGQGATAADHGLQATGERQSPGLYRRRQTKIGRQTDCHARAGRDQWHALEGRAHAQQIVVRNSVHDGHAHALRPQLGDARANGSLAARHHVMVNQPDLAPCLRLHHAHQISVRHGRERMVLHAAFAQQDIAGKEITFEDSALVVRESRCRNGEVGAQRVHQGFGDRADVALRCAVKGRAVLEVNLLGALRLQPLERRQRLAHRLGRRHSA